MPKEWSESYSLLHPASDAQHQELFRLANSVEALIPKETTKEVLAFLLKQFFNYMREHFGDEEAYMQSISYPLLAAHKKQHEHSIHAMTDLLKNTKRIEALQTKMKTVSHQWSVEHSLENNLKIVQWLNESKSNSIELDDYVIV